MNVYGLFGAFAPNLKEGVAFFTLNNLLVNLIEVSAIRPNTPKHMPLNYIAHLINACKSNR